MAATTRLLHIRPTCHLNTTPCSFHLFSSSSSSSTTTTTTIPPDSNDKSPEPDSETRSTSFFGDIKAKLKQQQQRNPPFRTPPKPFSFSPSTPPPNSSPSIEEIGRTLSGFRRRAVSPSPGPQPPSPTPPISFQDILQRNLNSRPQESSLNDGSSPKSSGLSAIKESLKRIKPTSEKNPNERFPKISSSMSLSEFRESLRMKPPDLNVKHPQVVFGGSDNLPLSVFGKEMKEKESEEDTAEMKTAFVTSYSVRELGEKLRLLRPEKKRDEKDWFSLEELNERLVKLRQMEMEKASKTRLPFLDMRNAFMKLRTDDEEKTKKQTMQRLEILHHLGRTPMLGPPKEQLVEMYFHPDNMSASEKLKLKLQKVREEFKISESDCGSARVQVAQLTTKINHLSTVLHKKDKHSRKGLQAMVQKRKSLLKYLRRTDWESYSFVLSRLGLRDNPDARH